jgi:hypothetical protein
MDRMKPLDNSALAASLPTLRDAAEAGALINPHADPALVVDTFIESYVYWREACEHVSTTCRHWRSCRPTQRALAFESYSAALDWEEHAARIHSSWAERLRACAHRRPSRARPNEQA